MTGPRLAGLLGAIALTGAALILLPASAGTAATAAPKALPFPQFVSVRSMGTQSLARTTYLGDYLAVMTYDRTPADGRAFRFMLCREAGAGAACEARMAPSGAGYGRFVRMMPSWVRSNVVTLTWRAGGRVLGRLRLTVMGK